MLSLLTPVELANLGLQPLFESLQISQAKIEHGDDVTCADFSRYRGYGVAEGDITASRVGPQLNQSPSDDAQRRAVREWPESLRRTRRS